MAAGRAAVYRVLPRRPGFEVITAALVARRVEPITVEDLLSRLEAVRRAGGGRWAARCPAHGDKGPSLSVKVGEGGLLLLHCFAGCEFSAILAALGLEARQLFPATDRPWVPKRPRIDPVLEARAGLTRLASFRVPPPPERMHKELRLVGRLMLGGTGALSALPFGFDPGGSLQTRPLVLVVEAMRALAAQGTPRRRFSPEALWLEVKRAGGLDGRHDLFLWARAAVHAYRWRADG